MATTLAPRRLRVMTWNVNGLRAVLQREKQKLQALLRDLDADIVCFQETKLTRSELDDELVRPEGYDAFYSFCRVRGGYSGVVTFVRSDIPTLRAEEGLTGTWKTETPVGHLGTSHHELDPKLLSELEAEGRCVITDHGAFVLLNVYCPAVRNSERLEYKLAFHDLLRDRVRALQRAHKRVVVVGDINIAHREIDHRDPSECGDLPFSDHPCRQWMDALLLDVNVLTDASAAAGASAPHDPGRLIDSFRYFHPLEARAFTCWNTKTGARLTNFGSRIDYILVDPALMRDAVTDCVLQPDRMGSDHCPVVLSAIVQLQSDGSDRATAALCARNFAEFAGKQQGITAFLSRRPSESSGGDASVSTESTASCTTPPGARKRPRSSSKPKQPSITSFFRQSSSATASRAASGSATRHHVFTAQSQQLQTTTTSHTDTATASASDDDVDIAKLLRAFEAKEQAAASWRQVLSGAPPKTPLCFCAQPTVLRTVLKTNDNWGRKFYVCTKPEGEKGHPDARCEFFQWLDDRSSSRAKRSKTPSQ